MITEFAQYDKPQIGDFVLAFNVLEDIDGVNSDVINFLYNNIGVFVEYDKNVDEHYRYKVKYENVSQFMLEYFEKGASTINIDEKWIIFQFNISEIKYSKNKKELEIYIQTKKYNI